MRGFRGLRDQGHKSKSSHTLDISFLSSVLPVHELGLRICGRGNECPAWLRTLNPQPEALNQLQPGSLGVFPGIHSPERLQGPLLQPPKPLNLTPSVGSRVQGLNPKPKHSFVDAITLNPFTWRLFEAKFGQRCLASQRCPTGGLSQAALWERSAQGIMILKNRLPTCALSGVSQPVR